MDYKLAPNFYAIEWVRSVKYPYLAFKVEELTDIILERMRMLSVCYLQIVRDEFGRTIIMSGIRPEALNEMLPGSSPDSAHKFLQDRCAVDISCPGHDIWKVAFFIINNCPGFRKMIVYPNRGFLHISFPDLSGIYDELYECKNNIYTRKNRLEYDQNDGTWLN